jgi:hypothetical protein
VKKRDESGGGGVRRGGVNGGGPMFFWVELWWRWVTISGEWRGAARVSRPQWWDKYWTRVNEREEGWGSSNPSTKSNYCLASVWFGRVRVPAVQSLPPGPAHLNPTEPGFITRWTSWTVWTRPIPFFSFGFCGLGWVAGVCPALDTNMSQYWFRFG